MEERESGLSSLGWAVGRFAASCGEVELEGELRCVKAIFSNMQGQGIYWQGWAAALRQLVADEGVALLVPGVVETPAVSVVDGVPPGPVARVDPELFPDRERFVDTVVATVRGVWPEWGGRLEDLLRHGLALVHGHNALAADRGAWLWMTDLPEVLADEGVGRGVADRVAGELGDPDLADWLKSWQVWEVREEALEALRRCLRVSGCGERGVVSFRLNGAADGPWRGVGLMRRGNWGRAAATVEVEVELEAPVAV